MGHREKTAQRDGEEGRKSGLARRANRLTTALAIYIPAPLLPQT
jgi:hypothetical protein